jgi:hypothetical protein
VKYILICIILLPAILFAQSAPSKPDWSAWQFLIGDWVGGGGGNDQNQGTGGFTFALDLQKQVITRRNFAEYPAAKDRPASRHDDFMIIYQSPDKSTRADYYDSEGHVIRYVAQLSKDGRSAEFLSDSIPAEPRYRLIYFRMGDTEVAIRFDIAPPGSSEFKQYIQATAHKK